MINPWFIFLFILIPVSVFSQRISNIENEKKEQVLPGKTTAVCYRIENDQSYLQVYDIKVTSSNPMIEPVIKQDSIGVPEKQSKIYIVPIRVSSEAMAGNYSVTIHFTHRGNGYNFTNTYDFTVSTFKSISLSAIEFPQYVRAGMDIAVQFQLKNNGNISEFLKLATKSKLVGIGDTISLYPGESKMVTISQSTDPNTPRNEIFHIKLTARSIKDSNDIWYANATTNIISAKPIENDIYYRFPVFASISYIGMRNKNVYSGGFQGEIYGSGSLTKENKDWLNLRAVSPSPISFNTFTQYEEYFINYKSKNLWVHLGDKAYSSSMLTEFSRYGRGAELHYRFKKITLGGFYNHPRFFTPIQDELNIFSTIQFNKHNEITAGYIYKVPKNDNTPSNGSTLKFMDKSHLPYIKANIQHFKPFKIQGEVSYSQTINKHGWGYLFQLQSDLKALNGNINYIRTSPYFAGYFNNTSMLNGSVRYRVSKKIDLNVNYIHDAKNIQRDSLTLAVPYREFKQYGVNYRYTKKGTLSLLAGTQRYEDRLEPKQFDYREDFARIGINQQIAFLNFNIESQFGKTNNYLIGFSGLSKYYTTNISFEKFRTTFNLYANFTETARYQLQKQQEFYYGFRTFTPFSDKTHLSIFYQNNYQPEQYYADRNLLEVLFHQQITRGQYFDVAGRYILQRGEVGKKDFIVSLKYTCQLNIPVKKTATYTSLSGNISNAGVTKVEGVKVILGHHVALTDKWGKYVFKNIVPGDYMLEIDRSTIGITDISNIPLPASMRLSGKENTFNFGLTAAASIHGTVQFEDVRENQRTLIKGTKNKSNSIIVEISNGSEVYKKVCILNKPFEFTYLRPGTWDIKVYLNGLGKDYRILTEDQKVILKPGEMLEYNIVVIKRKPEILYQQESIKVTYQQNK